MSSSRWLPLTGIVFVILLLVSIFLPGSLPNGNASGATVISYAKSNSNSLTISAIVIGFSLFFALLFYGQLRALLRSVPANEALATISFGGAVLFAAGGGVTAGAMLALADSPSALESGAAQALNMEVRDLALVLYAGLGILMFAAGIAIVRSHILATWLGWAGIVLGVITVAGVVPLGAIVLILGAIWTVAASILMMLRANAVEPTGAASLTSAMA
jgi:hypothetical protein